MTQGLALRETAEGVLEQVIAGGDLSKLSAAERLTYYRAVCESVGLNPLTQPFQYITLNGKLTLYARKDATDQLRERRKISTTIVGREMVDGIYVVTARAIDPHGRTEESIGAVPIEGLKGEAKANALMKGETKAKRRVTLSICGLGYLDETEVETIPDAVRIDYDTGEIRDARPMPASMATFESAKALGAAMSGDDDRARAQFWQTAKELEYPTKRAVHELFGVAPVEQALADYKRDTGLTWAQMTDQLTNLHLDRLNRAGESPDWDKEFAPTAAHGDPIDTRKG